MGNHILNMRSVGKTERETTSHSHRPEAGQKQEYPSFDGTSLSFTTFQETQPTENRLDRYQREREKISEMRMNRRARNQFGEIGAINPSSNSGIKRGKSHTSNIFPLCPHSCTISEKNIMNFSIFFNSDFERDRQLRYPICKTCRPIFEMMT